MRNKKYQVITRMTVDEKLHLYEQADLAGMSANDFVRSLIMQSKITPVNTELLHHVRKIGNNINQLARWANMNEGISHTQIQTIIDLQHRLVQLAESYGCN